MDSHVGILSDESFLQRLFLFPKLQVEKLVTAFRYYMTPFSGSGWDLISGGKRVGELHGL